MSEKPFDLVEMFGLDCFLYQCKVRLPVESRLFLEKEYFKNLYLASKGCIYTYNIDAVGEGRQEHKFP